MRKLIFFLIFCWCASPLMAFAGETPVKGGTLIWGRLADPNRLDLAQSSDMEAAQAAGQVLEGLLCFAPNSLEIRRAQLAVQVAQRGQIPQLRAVYSPRCERLCGARD